MVLNYERHPWRVIAIAQVVQHEADTALAAYRSHSASRCASADAGGSQRSRGGRASSLCEQVHAHRVEVAREVRLALELEQLQAGRLEELAQVRVAWAILAL